MLVAFSASDAGPSKKSTQMASRSPSPEPPGASRGPPGRAKTAQRGAKSGPRAAKTAPRAAQERLQSGLGGHLAPNCRPRGPQRPPGGHFGLLGARFSTLRGPIFEASAASSAAFREALSLASRPLESTAPEAKKARKCQNQEPANTSESRHVKKMRKQRPRQQRQSKQPLAPKRQANKGGRRCRACGAFRRPPLAVRRACLKWLRLALARPKSARIRFHGRPRHRRPLSP